MVEKVGSGDVYLPLGRGQGVEWSVRYSLVLCGVGLSGPGFLHLVSSSWNLVSIGLEDPQSFSE